MQRVLVTGATGFIGREVVQGLAASGYRVVGLTREARGARSELGVEWVLGDLLRCGDWMARVGSAEAVVHLAQPRAFGGRVTRERAEAYRAARLSMDANLLEAARGAARILYVAGTSYYGDTGLATVDEDVAPRPRGWGPYIAPAVDRMTAAARRGPPAVMAFPGYVYGDGSWFREYVLRPLRSRSPLFVPAGRSRTASTVHVSDCARALVHLLEHGADGARYFVVDDQPVPWSAFHALAADAIGVATRTVAVSPRVLGWLAGPLVRDSLSSDSNLSNARLKRSGFGFSHPTIRTGVPDVVRRARPTAPLPSVGRILWRQATGG